jgi:dihydroorotase
MLTGTKLSLFLFAMSMAWAQTDYDLVLKGGRVIDGKNKINAIRDVAVKDGKIALVAPNIPATQALKAVDVSGLIVTPGLIDIHTHVFGGNSVPPDGFTFRVGVTTVVDAGGSGWRDFEDYKTKVVDQSKTRVLAFINIVGHGMGGSDEQNPADMEVKPTAEMAQKHKGLIVGLKVAHYNRPDWIPFERAEEVGKIAGIPVMVDFGNISPSRQLYELLNKVFRPGDIYTHMYSSHRGEQDPDTLGPSKAMVDGRKRGVYFDVGHGRLSFLWRLAVPMTKAGFWPDSISTDLHNESINTGLQDMLNLMDKFLLLGMPLDEVILRSTWNPAKEIQHEELGHLSVGAPADIAVLRLEKGNFGFVDMYYARMDGTQKLQCEMTLRDGKVVFDLNGRTREDWRKLPAGYGQQGDPSWDSFAPRAPARKRQ